MSIAAILFLTFAVLLLANIPIGIGLGVASVAAMMKDGLPMELLSMQMYANIAKFLLLAIPFFILAGNIMEKAGISSRLINLANKCVGHISGGLAIVVVITCCFFAAISGSGPATVAALGSILIPAMMKMGYGEEMPSALLATAGAIGIIIPPSIAYVVYGSISGVSIGKIFMAGIIPGILMGVCLIVVALIICKKKNIKKMEKASAKERWIAFKDAIWGLLMPVIILGGIYGGFFTPTEAAAVAAVYGLLVGVFVYKSIKLKDLVRLLIDSAKGTASVMLIVACASLFAWFCQTSGISRQVSDLLYNVSGSKFVFLLIVNVVLLIAGCFIDANSALYILVPIILPVANKFGYDPVALGVFMTMNLAIGQVTPPVGVNLYVACGISGINLQQISKAVIPFMLASLVALLLITYIPEITLLLPNLLGK
ncbi:TRAP transporter large permease [Eubacteriales bacterium OttesenSCG-928-K08]|nr:TRAP transporter large permease [Eubacteriales bacterium OttesenSCG-928-K08]